MIFEVGKQAYVSSFYAKLFSDKEYNLNEPSIYYLKDIIMERGRWNIDTLNLLCLFCWNSLLFTTHSEFWIQFRKLQHYATIGMHVFMEINCSMLINSSTDNLAIAVCPSSNATYHQLFI